MAAAAVLFVTAAAVIGIVVFQQTQQAHAQAVSRSTALAQQGMEVYLTALRIDPDYWSSTPTIAGIGQDGTWTVAANVASSTITAVGHDSASGILHVIRASVRPENYSDYTIISDGELDLGSGVGGSDIRITGNVRSNTGITLNQRFMGMNAYYVHAGSVTNSQYADNAEQVAPIEFSRALDTFPNMYTAATSRSSWTDAMGNPTSSDLQGQLAFYRDANTPSRNYWGADATKLSPAGSGIETDLVGVGVDFTHYADHTTGLFYIRSVWPAVVPSVSATEKATVSRQQFIDFARHDPTWNVGPKGALSLPGRSFSITKRGFDPNGSNVIYAGGDLDVYVRGEFFRSVTIVSERDIYVIGPITRSSDPAASPTATVGLVAKRNIYICAAMPEQTGSGVYRTADGSSNGYTGKTYTRGSADPKATGEVIPAASEMKVQAALMAVTGGIIMDPRPEDVTSSTVMPDRRSGTLKIEGSLITHNGLQGLNFANEYDAQHGGFAHTEINYDTQLQETPPPLFPQIGAGSLKVVRWDEFTTTVDPNAGLEFPPPGHYTNGGPTPDGGNGGGGSSGGNGDTGGGGFHIIPGLNGDTQSPETTSNMKSVYNGEAVITLSATDDSGRAWTWYTVDGGEVTTGTTVELPPLADNTVETRTVTFWSMDQAGNAEPPQTVQFKMIGRDTISPFTTVIDSQNPSKDLPDGYPQLDDPDYVVWGDFAPKFTAVDTTTGLGVQEIWFIRDGVPNFITIDAAQTSAEETVPAPSYGSVSLHYEYYAIDNAGNRERTKSLTVVQRAYDNVAPITYFDAQPVYVGKATVHLTAVDDVEGQGVKDTWYQLDDGPWVASVNPTSSMSYTTTVTVPAPSIGNPQVTHTLRFYSSDMAWGLGRKSKPNTETAQAVSFIVAPPLPDDFTAPVTTSDAKASYVGPATINLFPTDAGGIDHVDWRLDDGAVQTGTRIEVPAPWTGSVVHHIDYWATDLSGNVESPKTDTFTVTPERIAPTTSAHNLDLYAGPAVFQLTAEDNPTGSGLKATYYSIDDGPYQLGVTTPLGLTWVTVTGDGVHTVAFYSTDNAENSEAPKTTTLRIDTTPPVTTDDHVAAYAGEAVINLTATDSGSGVKFTHWKNQSDGYEQVSNPVLLGPGTWDIVYWSTDMAGNVESPKTLHTVVTETPDTSAPSSYDDVTAYYKGGQTPPAIINLYSWDVQSGVDTMFYKLDGVLKTFPGVGNPPLGYQFTVTGDATHTVEYWAADKAGNVESPHHTKSFMVDTVLPVTTCSARAGATYWATQTFSLTAVDDGSGVKSTYYSLDGSVATKGSSIYVAAPRDGYSRPHVIQFWSVDNAGNIESVRSVAFTSKPADTIAPTTFSNAVSSYAGAATVSLLAYDNVGGSGVAHTYYKIDTGATTEGTLVGISGSGTHTLEFWSVDNAGNIESPHKTVTYNVDGLPPTTVSDARALYNGPADIRLTATDNAGGSDVAYTWFVLDGGAATTGTAPITTMTVTAAGSHTLEFWSADTAGNVETPHKSATFIIDLTPPVTTSNALASYNGTATITLNATDNSGGSGVAYTYYKVDSGSRQTGTSIVVAGPVSGAASHTLAFWSVDAAGNTEAQKTATFTVAAVAPMTFSGMTPAENATINVRNPDVAVTAQAAQQITTATAVIDGKTKVPTLTYAGGYWVNQGYWDGGYWETDGCDTWYVDPYWVDTSYYVPLDNTKATATFPTAGLANGNHIVSVTFTVASGATNSKTWSFTVTAPPDTTPPVTTSNAQTYYASVTATISLTATDQAGGMGVANTYYKLDGAAPVAGTPPTTTVVVGAQGQHTLQYWSVDGANNTETVKTATYTVDYTPPTTTSNGVASYAGTATISLTATDNVGGSGVKFTYYKVDGGAQSTGTSIVVPGPLSGGGVAHSVSFWSVDKAGNIEGTKTANFTVTMPPDSTPPTTISNAVATYTRPSAITLTATDNVGGWGVANTFYKLDGGAVTTGTAPGTGFAGAHTLSFWSVDAAGNKEATKTASFTVLADTTPPTTTSNAMAFYIGPATVTLTATDGVSGWGVANTYFRLDAGAVATGTIINVTAPIAGSVSHTIDFWSVDAAGNREATKTASFLVWGLPAPMTFSGVTPADGAVLTVTNPNVSVTAQAQENLVGVTATLDGVPQSPSFTLGGGYWVSDGHWEWDDYDETDYWVDTSYWVSSDPTKATAAFTTSGLPNGSHTVAVTFTVASGAQTTKTWSFMIDNLGPTTTSNAAASYTGTATITLTATDNSGGSGIKYTYYKVDTGAQQTGTSIVVPPPAWGSVAHTIYFWSVDNAGNIETTKSASFTSNALPDSIAPVTTSNAATAYAQAATITLTATDNTGGWGVANTFWKLDSGAVTTGTAPTTAVSTGLGGSHTLYYWSVDRAGNKEATKSVSYTVTPDNTPPTTTSNALASYTTTANITLTATDNVGGWGVAYTSWTLDGGPENRGTSIVVPPPLTGAPVTHTLLFWSTDKATNVEATKTATFTISAIPAMVTFSGMTPADLAKITTANASVMVTGQAAATNIESASATLDGVPVGVTLTYRTYASTVTTWVVSSQWVDGYYDTDGCDTWWVDGYWQDTSHWVTTSTSGTDYTQALAKFQANGLSEGTHTVSVTMVVTNGQIATKTWSFMVDTVAPRTTSSVVASYTGNPSISLTATDPAPGSGVRYTYYKVDSGAAVNGTFITFAAPPSGSATHTIQFWSVDWAGNTETANTTTNTVTFTVNAAADYTQPMTTCNVQPYYKAISSITMTATDVGWGVRYTFYKLDGVLTTGTAPVTTFSTGGAGTHTLEYWSVDLAGNIEAHHNATYIVDLVAPTTVSSAVTSYTANASFSLTATDNAGGSGVLNTFYKVDTTGTVQTGTSVNVAGPAAGAAVAHTVFFWSTDRAGNVEATKSVGFSIAASAAGMTFSGETPAEFSNVIVRNPNVAVTGQSTTTRTIIAASGTIDGVAKTTTLVWGSMTTTTSTWVNSGYYRDLGTQTWIEGHWEDDGCDTWWVDGYWAENYEYVDTSGYVTTTSTVTDYGKATATFATTGLADGVHTAAITFTVSGGMQATRTWTFTVTGPDVAAPITTPIYQGAYVGTATVSLVATDGPTGSGVKYTYYKVDGGSQLSGTPPTTTVTILAPAYGSPVAHSIVFWSVDNLGNTEAQKSISFTVAPMPDSIAPVTVSSAVASYTGNASISLTATDNPGGWGVANTYYKVDTGVQQTGTSISVPAPAYASAPHTLYFWSVDRAGNTEATKTATFTVNAQPDNTAPTTTSNANSLYSAVSTITLSPVDNSGGWGIANTYYRRDGGTITTGTAVGTGVEGTHTVQFWSVDRAGNVEATKSVNYTVDMTKPTTTSNALGSYTTSAAITLAATDNLGGSGIGNTFYKVDAGVLSSGTLVSVAGPASGPPVSHTLYFWSVDRAGNVETTKSATFTISPPPDSTAPNTTSTVVPFYAMPGTISLIASDNVGGWGVGHTYYILDGASQAEGTSVGTGGSGQHTIEFWSVDNAGNVESHKTKSYNVDMTAPVTSSNAVSSYTGTATVTLTAADNAQGSGVKFTYYKVDAGTQTSGTVIAVAPPTWGSATHTIYFWSVDVMGNAETQKTATFTVNALPDSTPPSTTSNAVASYSKPATITLTATDNTGGWGVANTYFKLDSGAVTTGTLVGTGGGGSHTLLFWSVDRAGNVEATKTATYTVTPDTTPPVTTSNAVGLYVGPANITLTATDSGWGVAYTHFRLDSGAETSGTAISVTAPIAGSVSHTIYFWSVDQAGNVEATNTATFTVSGIPANVTWSGITPADGSTITTNAVSVSVNAKADQNITAVTATLDGTAKTPSVSIVSTSAAASFQATGLTNGVHTVAFTVTNASGAQATKVWTFTVAVQTDFTPPTTTSNALSSYIATANIALTATDNVGGSGVKATYYRVDSGAQTTGTAIVVAGPASGAPVSHTVYFWSVDNAGNVEATKSATFTVAKRDTTPPTTTSDAKLYYNAPSTIFLSATDDVGGSGVAHTYYKLDAAATVEGTMLGTGGTGTHVLEFWSVDVSGNFESPHNVITYKVDVVAPVTTSNAVASYTGGATIALTATDDAGGSGVKYTYYKVDDGGQTSGAVITIAPPTAAAMTHTVYFWSVDNAGNIETTKSATFTVAALPDTTAPTTISDAKSSYPVPGLITLTATDNYGGWGVETTFYKLDSGAITEGLSIRTGGVGTHTLEFWSKDKANNIETPHKTKTYTVAAADTAPPVTTSNAAPTYVGPVTISLTATDNCGVLPVTYFRVDSGTDTTGTTINVLAPRAGSASHTIYFWSIDLNGNVESVKSATFIVNALPADMTFSAISPADGSTASVRNPVVTVTATSVQNAITSAVLELDGVQKPATAVINFRTATLTYGASGLSNGSHTVVGVFTDSIGAISTKMWTFTVTAPGDGTPPVTTTDGEPTYNGTAVIRLFASDEVGGTGVAATYYRLDNGFPHTSTVTTTTITITEPGPHSVEYWSVDAAGNQEWPHKTLTFYIDVTPPTTMSDAQDAYDGTAIVHLSPTDNVGGSGVKATYYQVDSAAAVTGTVITVAPPASDGAWHTIYWWSVDNAGNVESTKTATFKVWAPEDAVAPTTVSNAQTTYSVPGVILLTATDNAGGWGVAHTYYRFDGAAQVEGTIIGTGGQGTHTIEFWSVDNAGNIETHKTVTYTVSANDVTAPTTTSDAVASYQGAGQINLTATDNVGGSGVAHTYYRWDGGPQIESTIIGVSGAGSHSITFWSVDWAGNIESFKTATFTVVSPDLTAPTTTSNAQPSYTGTATIVLTPTDNTGGAGVRATFYRLDGGSLQTGTSVQVLAPVSGSVAHTIQFWSVDNANNAEAEKTVSFTVNAMPDVTAPTTTSNAVASYTGTATIALTATDNTNGSGVKFTYYKIDAGGTQQTGTTAVVVPPASGSASHTIYFWSVDNANNTETTKSYTFVVNAPVVVTGNTTLSFRWHPYDWAEANLHVENATTGAWITSNYVSGYDSDLDWDVVVPAGQSYRLVCDYYWCDDGEESSAAYGMVSGVTTPDTPFVWWY